MSSVKRNTKCHITYARQMAMRQQHATMTRNIVANMATNVNATNMGQRSIVDNLVDFATTACNRPHILEQTYYSLSQRIKGINLKQCRLFLNIDPMPNSDNIEDNIRVAEKYFGEVIWNIPNVGNFPQAFNWCINKIEKPYCLYVQDDWLFVQDFSIKTLISLIKGNNQIASINIFKIDGGSSNSYRIYLSPSLFKTNHFKKINKLLLPNYSPEKQLRPMHPQKNPYPYGGRILKILRYHGVCYRKNHMPMVRDLGRPWMKQKGLNKKGGIFNNFQTWSGPGMRVKQLTSTSIVIPTFTPSTTQTKDDELIDYDEKTIEEVENKHEGKVEINEISILKNNIDEKVKIVEEVVNEEVVNEEVVNEENKTI